MKRLITLLVVLVLLVSCSGSESGEGESTTGAVIYPDLVMENTSCQVGRSDDSPIILTAEKMTLYSSDGYALLENFSFRCIGGDGETETEGKAEKGSVELDGSSIELEGTVSFSSPGDNMHIEAENLVYSRDTDEITTKGRVVVNSDEGEITGRDFRGDLRRSVYTFSGIEKGDFEIE